LVYLTTLFELYSLYSIEWWGYCELQIWNCTGRSSSVCPYVRLVFTQTQLWFNWTRWNTSITCDSWKLKS